MTRWLWKGRGWEGVLSNINMKTSFKIAPALLHCMPSEDLVSTRECWGDGLSYLTQNPLLTRPAPL